MKTMGLTNILLLSQFTTYILTLFLAFCIFLPLSFHLVDFKGHCLLFSNGTWQETDGQLMVDWASPIYCGYNIIWAFASFLICFVQSYAFARHLYRGTDSSFLSAFLDFLVCTVLSVSALCGAVLISVGYQHWCSAILRRFESCQDATLNDIDKKDNISTKLFYIHLGTAQFGAWASWTCWVGLTILALVKVCNFHQQENIRVSMAHERARLIRDGRLH